MITAVKAKNWIALAQASSGVGLNYGAGKLYDAFKEENKIGDIINPENQSSFGTSTYDILTSPDGGLPGGVEEINGVNTTISHSTATQNTSIYQNRTTIITPNGEVILPGNTAQQTTVSSSTVYSSTNSGARPATTNISIGTSYSTTTGYHSPSITQLDNTTTTSNLNIQTNFPDQLRSTVGKGLLENVIKDIGDFITFNLMAHYGEDEIVKSFLEHEVSAIRGIKVIENQF